MVASVAAPPGTLLGSLDALDLTASGEPPFLSDLRGRARERFGELGFPTPRLEDWRFTNLRKIADAQFTIAARSSETPAIEPWSIPGAHRLVLVDGVFVPELSATEGLPPGALLTSLALALDRSPELVEPYLEHQSVFDDHAIVALNTALFRDGAFLWLPPGTVVEHPIHLLMLATAGRDPSANLPRNLIVIGPSSQATVIETFAGTGGQTLTCPVTEIVLAANASLEHHVLHEDGDEANHLAAHSVRVDRDSNLRSHAIMIGGGLIRNDVRAVLDGEGSHVELNGLYVTDNHQHVDNQLRVRHATPHCTSRQLYKGILDGASSAVFNGRIVVAPDAQKTDARQTNRNLLLSNGALVRSNPQLEIFADDVRCTHGSTVGRLDEDSLFYLRSRGLDRAAAESLLIYAFASDVVHDIGVDAVRRRLEQFLFARLPHGELIREAV